MSATARTSFEEKVEFALLKKFICNIVKIPCVSFVSNMT
ncbi:hypothetical protein AC51_0983 [Escherichia coli 5-172-05_S3_C3]|nr:hypothetical protein AC51_0983 [Escherichia coli 5-172-05_S3_C3]